MLTHPVSNRRRSTSIRAGAARAAAAALAVAILVPAIATAQLRRAAPQSLTDAEFWEFFTTRSEPGGSFLSENFVSNETSFENVIPTLQRSLTPGGVYLGVGPEQNFTYIANLQPRLAVIVDIRRQNAMEHLMYKALFELSPTRAEFVSRLFSRPLTRPVPEDAPVADLFAAVQQAPASDSAYRANRDAIISTLTSRHHFALADSDIASIDHVYDVFHQAGPSINYAYRPTASSLVRGSYPTYDMLQSATNADNTQMAFLATEGRYRAVRDLEGRNLVIPLVGDFAGPKAIRSIGEYLRQRDMTVTAFYLSNVEQYLFQNRVSAQFYQNVISLPTDSTSTFIRSVPGSGLGAGAMFGSSGVATFAFSLTPGSANPLGGTAYSVTVVDSGGVQTTRTTRDSAGQQVSSVTRDSGGVTVRRLDSVQSPVTQFRVDSLQGQLDRARIDSLMSSFGLGVRRDSTTPGMYRAPGAVTFQARPGGSLTSGLAPIGETLSAFAADRLLTYQAVITMTKIDGWKK